MCGIVGYTGKRNACEVIIKGLNKLQYRGYDSSGIAVISEGKLKVKKYKGTLEVLEAALDAEPLSGHTGIGHTRWATHGAPSDENAHPHTSNDNLITLVHNGIIENYVPLRKELLEKGYKFSSETDTEVVVHLIRDCYHGDLLDAVMSACKRLKGAYALVVICRDEPGRIIATKNSSPLIVGLAEGENFVASDIPAVLEYTRLVCPIEENTFCDVRADGVKMYDTDKNEITPKPITVTWSAEDAEKGEYPHFMLKEIYEQPTAIANTLRARISGDSLNVDLSPFEMDEKTFKAVEKITIIACGTSYYAGCAGKKLLETYSGKPVSAQIASEYRYEDNSTDSKTLVIVISQSGETADTLESLKLAHEKGARVVAITNVVGSNIAREADDVLYTWAGPEIAVASTKAYSTQVMCMYMLSLKFGLLAGYDRNELTKLRDICLNMSTYATNALGNAEEIKEIAGLFRGQKNAFYIGRGLDSAVAMEGALKMKEISYIHAEAYPAGELKHGPIALIEDGTPVVALCTQKGELCEKTLSNIKEVKARGAYAIVIAQKGTIGIESEVDRVIYIEECDNNATVIPTVMKLQLLAYYAACENGCDVDKPRNLAKSVTVE